MKTYLSAILLVLFTVSYSQVITEEEFRNKVKAAQEQTTLKELIIRALTEYLKKGGK